MAYNPLCAMCCSHVGIKGGQSQFLEVSSSRVMLNSTEDFVSQRGKLTLGSAFANSRINYLFFVFLPVPSYSFFFFLIRGKILSSVCLTVSHLLPKSESFKKFGNILCSRICGNSCK